MAEPTLQFLGEQIARIQSELRDLRNVRSDVAHLRAELNDRTEEIHRRIEGLEAAVSERIWGLEAAVGERIDSLARANNAQFAQVHETMAINLAAVLEAIKAAPG
jgi:predicted  nucleic acid-binding Zn-ribbon protein